MPETRRAESRKLIPETCDESVMNQVLFTAGSVDNQRAANWRRLFLGQEELPTIDLNDIKVSELPTATVRKIDMDVHRTDSGIDFYYPNTGDWKADLERPRLASLKRILLTYASKHPDVDYVQGMNEIASPILYVMEGAEDVAYLIFERVMRRQHQYFGTDGHTRRQLLMLFEMLQVADPLLHDQLGLSAYQGQPFIAYRWLLVLFKREVGFYHFPLVLETIFAAPTSSYELFIALALLLTYRHEIMKIGHHFDEMLQFYGQLAGKHDVEKLLVLADQLHQYFSSDPVVRNDPRFTSLIK